MAAKSVIALLLVLVAAAVADDCSGPANTLPIYDQDLTLVKTVTNGYLYQAAAQQGNVLRVAHVYGTSYDMGKAQAALFGSEIVDMVKGLEQYMYDTMAQYIKKLPLDIQKILEEKGVAAALQFTADLTKQYTPQHYFDEARGMADGLNGALSYDELYNIQMFPEVIKASCSMFGAWGKAIENVNGTLIQLRALDFGMDSPLVNHSIVIVYHPAPGYGNPFTSVSWVGFIGSVTSFSGFVGMSEKVWLHYNLTYSRAGVPFHFLIRDVAQFDVTIDDAINRMVNSVRTCSVFLGVGDNYTNTFRVCEYGHDEVLVYDDRNFPAYPGHPLLEGLVFVDKHTQPSDDPCLGSLVQQYYGKLSPENTLRNIVAPFGTGDMHAAIYDYETGVMYVSIAGLQISPSLQPVPGSLVPAFSRPWFKLNARALQALPAPSTSA